MYYLDNIFKSWENFKVRYKIATSNNITMSVTMYNAEDITMKNTTGL